MSTKPLYALRKTEVYEALETSIDGLTSKEAEVRRALYGFNALTETQTTPAWKTWFRHTTHPMALVLWAAGTAAIWIGRCELGIVIWIVVIINAIFSLWQEHRADQAVSALNHLLPHTAQVVRDGREIKIATGELVPGDVLMLAEGDNISADARLVEAYGLRINNATLTGESIPAIKTADTSIREDLTEIERPNLVFAGTSITSGTGKAVVYATGMLTQFGRIANLTQKFKEEPSLMQAP